MNLRSSSYNQIPERESEECFQKETFTFRSEAETEGEREKRRVFDFCGGERKIKGGEVEEIIVFVGGGKKERKGGLFTLLRNYSQVSEVLLRKYTVLVNSFLKVVRFAR